MLIGTAEKRMNGVTSHANLHLLGIERTGWRRFIFGRWVFNSEPFRRDIQRACAANKVQVILEPWERLYPEDDS